MQDGESLVRTSKLNFCVAAAEGVYASSLTVQPKIEGALGNSTPMHFIGAALAHFLI